MCHSFQIYYLMDNPHVYLICLCFDLFLGLYILLYVFNKKFHNKNNNITNNYQSDK